MKKKPLTKSIIKSLPAELTTVTKLSKSLAAIVFILLPFIGFLLGIRYGEFNMATQYQEMALPQTNLTKPPKDQVFCTQDAMMCSDGSYVGRVGPNCEFAACPVQ